MAGKYKAVQVALRDGSAVKVYASPRVGEALRELSKDMTLYQGVRFLQVLEAVYVQGKKDGARNAFDQLDVKVAEARTLVPHRKPGRPRKS